jgi:hypothetical protein
MSKKDTSLTPLQQLRNLCDVLAEETLGDNRQVTKREQAALDRLKAEIREFAEDHATRSQAEKTAPQWAGRAMKLNTSTNKTRGG